MPYIDEAARARLKHGCPPTTAGELNYLITKAVDAYLGFKGLRYEHLNAAIGALQCAQLELYRRIAAPYEDQKLAENGEVYAAAPAPAEPDTFLESPRSTGAETRLT